MIDKIKFRELTPRVMPASRDALQCFSRAELMAYAKSLGVPVGRGKAETVTKLLHSGKATICATLGN